MDDCSFQYFELIKRKTISTASPSTEILLYQLTKSSEWTHFKLLKSTVARETDREFINSTNDDNQNEITSFNFHNEVRWKRRYIG